MPQKVSPEIIKKYSEDFCAAILSKAYSQKNVLNGQDLLNLTPLRQINQNIVSRLSVYWNSQLQNFKSAYFDFTNPAIQEAMRQFSAVVSQHIALQQSDLAPWLADAVNKSLEPFINIESLTPELELRQHQFSQVLPLVLFPEPVVEVVEETPTNTPISFFDFAQEEEEEKFTPASVATPTYEPVVTPPIVTVPEPIAKEPEPTPVVATSAPSIQETEVISPAKNTLEFPSLSDEVHYGNVNVKIESISQNIPLGQRFMFINQLFGGDFNAFNSVVELLDQASSLDQARKLLGEQIVPQYNWDVKGDAAVEFLLLVRRRFA